MFQHARDALLAPNRTAASTSRCSSCTTPVTDSTSILSLPSLHVHMLSVPSNPFPPLSFLNLSSSVSVTSHHATAPLQHTCGHPRPRSRKDVLDIRLLLLFFGNVDTMHFSRVTVRSGVSEEHVKNHMTKRFMCDMNTRRRLFFWRAGRPASPAVPGCRPGGSGSLVATAQEQFLSYLVLLSVSSQKQVPLFILGII